MKVFHIELSLNLLRTNLFGLMTQRLHQSVIKNFHVPFFYFESTGGVIEVSIWYRNSASYFLKVLCNLVIKNIIKCYYLVLDIDMIMWHISLHFP